ncbi:twin-arginine translocation signal domain-containing protein, partial [bacterium]|nr:twin-arginine translocation signal domain-containing protein [bacterium]
MTQENSVTRRNFLKRSGGASAAAFSAPLVVSTNVFGANETVNLGFISVGRRSGGLMNDFRNTKGSQIVAVSDVNQPRMDRVVGNKNWKKYPDYRKMLDAKDVDAVVISTPDHWHALNSIHACMAGKDVYVEKPMTLTIVEGRQMVKAARKYDRVVQCGSQQRSDAKCRIGCEMVRNGRVGKIHTVHADNYHSPWDRPFPSQPVPDGLNWDMWLGPADWRDYHRDIYIPRARPGWISIVPFSGGVVTGWGAHGLDIIQWGLDLDQTGPVEIWTEGSSRDLNRVVHMKYANGIKVVTDGKGPAGGGLFEGDKGTVIVSRGVYKVNP